MMDESKATAAFDDEFFQQSLDEGISIPVEEPSPGPAGTADRFGGSNRLVPVAVVIVILSLIGFTASNWMLHKQTNMLAAQIESVEARLDKAASAGRDDKGRKAAVIRQTDPETNKHEIEIRQLADQVSEITQTVAALRSSLGEMSRLRSGPAAAKLQEKKLPAPSENVAGQDTKKNKSGVEENKLIIPPKNIAGQEKKVEPGAGVVKLDGAGKGTVRKHKGVWTVYLVALEDEKLADEELAKLKKAGISARKSKIRAHGKVYYQLRTGRFEWTADGRAFIRDVAIKAGYKSAWLGPVKD